MQRLSWKSMVWNSYYESGEPVRTLDSLDMEESRRHTQPVRGEGRGAAVRNMTRTGLVANPPLAGGGETYGGPES